MLAIMRTFCFTLLLAIVFPCALHGEDLIPGIVTFDPPPFLNGGTSGRGSDDLFSGTGEVRQYSAADNDIRTSQRRLHVNVRAVGFSIGDGKVVTYHQLDDKALRGWMQAVMDSNRNATNIARVADAKVGGQPALVASYQVAQWAWPKEPGALFPIEVYWVRIQTNRVVEIELIADTPKHLETLRPCLGNFSIKRKDG